VAGTAALDYAREHHGLASNGGAADAAGGNARGGRHHELGAVFDWAGGVQEQDVLSAGADIYGEDAHAAILDRDEWQTVVARNENTDGAEASSLHLFDGLLGGVMMVGGGGGRTRGHEFAVADQTWREYEFLHGDSFFRHGREQDRLTKVGSKLAAPEPALF
jgi:hypothetical protein